MEESIKSKVVKGGISKVVGASVGTLVGKFVLLADPSLAAGTALILGKAIAEGCSASIAQSIYDDVRHRAVSISEHQTKKIEMVYEIARNKFVELLAKSMDTDHLVSIEFELDKSVEEQAFGAAEHVFVASMNQYNEKKLAVLGKLYGKAFFDDKRNFDDLHLAIDIADRWSYRQMLLLYLTCNNWCGLAKELYITDARICIELRRLQNDGVWFVDGVPMSINNALPIQIAQLRPTEFAKELYDELVLDEICIDDVKVIMNDLKLTKDAEGIEVIPPDEVKNPMWGDASGPVLDAGEY